jgi:hypothetical protein
MSATDRSMMAWNQTKASQFSWCHTEPLQYQLSVMTATAISGVQIIRKK